MDCSDADSGNAAVRGLLGARASRERVPSHTRLSTNRLGLLVVRGARRPLRPQRLLQGNGCLHVHERPTRRCRRSTLQARQSDCSRRSRSRRDRLVADRVGVGTSRSGQQPRRSSTEWFNVRRMTREARFILLDQASMNELGAFPTFEEAERTLLRFVSARRARRRFARDLGRPARHASRCRRGKDQTRCRGRLTPEACAERGCPTRGRTPRREATRGLPSRRARPWPRR